MGAVFERLFKPEPIKTVFLPENYPDCLGQHSAAVMKSLSLFFRPLPVRHYRNWALSMTRAV